ncbi:MAG: D-alanyl-D-alanine carboxypeptidase [Thermoflavifilum sp.]|nr:D-alanyl-D-alanine carboxypeptidase [Thermoflavifilum sp.]
MNHHPYAKAYFHLKGLLVTVGLVGLTGAGCALVRPSIATRHQVKHFTSQWLHDSVFRGAQVGISVYDYARQRTVLQHQSDHYFNPASNTKLFTLFAGLHLLSDSSTGILYQTRGDTLFIQGTADPSLFHPEFAHQPVVNFLRTDRSRIMVWLHPVNRNEIWGPGWAWNDYAEDYQPERSSFPLYGNVIWCTVYDHHVQMLPDYFMKAGLVRWDSSGDHLAISRLPEENLFTVHPAADTVHVQIPYRVMQGAVTAALLADTLHKPVLVDLDRRLLPGDPQVKQLKNVPLDSLFRHMMFRSDNFYAEQTLMMSSYRLFDTIDTRKVIAYVLDSLLPALPQRPQWVDGSGLSRLNLFTPDDIVYVLMRLLADFSEKRIFSILPTGGAGTLTRYPDLWGVLYAKTGSLSNQAALSGYLLTRSGHTLIFSMLVGNYVSSPALLRNKMGDWLRWLASHY